MTRIRLGRAICIDGRRCEPGQVLDVPEVAALELVESGRAQLMRADDLPALHAARAREVRAMLKAQAAPAFAGPPADPRWLHVA